MLTVLEPEINIDVYSAAWANLTVSCPLADNGTGIEFPNKERWNV